MKVDTMFLSRLLEENHYDFGTELEPFARCKHETGAVSFRSFEKEKERNEEDGAFENRIKEKQTTNYGTKQIYVCMIKERQSQ